MWWSIVETTMGEEYAAEGGRQHKFTRIVMVRVHMKRLVSKISCTENLSHVGMRVSMYKSRAA